MHTNARMYANASSLGRMQGVDMSPMLSFGKKFTQHACLKIRFHVREMSLWGRILF